MLLRDSRFEMLTVYVSLRRLADRERNNEESVGDLLLYVNIFHVNRETLDRLASVEIPELKPMRLCFRDGRIIQTRVPDQPMMKFPKGGKRIEILILNFSLCDWV